ncbi:MAG: Imm26 family immunity protein [Streptosporangiaceae bacterium]
MAKVKYREGDWFAVPLQGGGFAVGLIARANPGGVLLGYFFGPRRSGVPALSDVAGLRPDDAVLVRKFGHLGIAQGKWPLLGRADGWDRREWPTPVFIRYEELTGRSFRVIYDDDDPNKVLREELIAPGEAEQGPKDGLMGAGFAEAALTRLLA